MSNSTYQRMSSNVLYCWARTVDSYIALNVSKVLPMYQVFAGNCATTKKILIYMFLSA